LKPRSERRLRILFVYDCLYPHTIGGFERFYRDLAERLAMHHEITYLTRSQWAADQQPDCPPGVKLIALDSGRDLYTASGRRRILPPLRFGAGVLFHLLRNRHRYDIVHTCSFPYFPLISASIARTAGGPPIVTDWIEVWSRDYWRRYLGPIGGAIGDAVQKLCIRLTANAFTLSELTANALRANGYRKHPVILKGLSTTAPTNSPQLQREPLVVFAGRHIPEKHVIAIPAAIGLARQQLPGLHAVIFGDGPERGRVSAEINRLGLEDVIRCPGFVAWHEVDDAMRRAMCLILLSEREGYGSVVIEAIARGTPAIVVQGPDNASTSLIVENVNGFVSPSTQPAGLAEQIIKIHRAGPELIARTYDWFRQHADKIGIEASIAQIEEVYASIAD
jgi:glycosyltransferase involved in cell wall biosynthesis